VCGDIAEAAAAAAAGRLDTERISVTRVLRMMSYRDCSGGWIRDVRPQAKTVLGEPIRCGRTSADPCDQHAGFLVAVHALQAARRIAVTAL